MKLFKATVVGSRIGEKIQYNLYQSANWEHEAKAIFEKAIATCEYPDKVVKVESV